MNKKSSVIRYIILAVLLVVIIVSLWLMLGNSKGPTEIDYDGKDSFISRMDGGTVAAIYVSGNYNVYILQINSKTTVENFFKNPEKTADSFVRIPSRASFDEKLTQYQGKDGYVAPRIKYDDPNGKVSWTSYIFPAASLLLMGILLFFIFKQGAGANKQAMSFGKTKARLNTTVKVKFADVAGAEEEKEELKEIVDFLKSPQKFTDLGARIPKGVLLVGPPGTGKTLFAKAVAGESNVPFFSISGSDFVEMFVGTGAARVRDLFDQAKKNMPCIIFIDEIDAVGRHRGAGLGGGNDEREQTLNQLLVQMDGFETNDGVIIIAATNRVDILDPALMRPGRFDRQIYVNIPDVKGREAIFKVHSRNKPIAGDISFKVLARMTSGFSGADIENLLNEASILAARANRKVIIMEDILEAINKVIAGPQKKSRIITETDKRITAYHESGHAIIAKVLPNCDEVQEVSIIPRGMAAGYTLTRPESDDSHISKNKLIDMITMMLGGRAAEEIVIHDVSTGASNDIERATAIARSMVTEWGMSKVIGTMFLGGEKEVFLGKDYGAQHSYSQQIGSVIDSEMKAIIDSCYDKAIEIIKSHRAVLDNMVKVLFEKETIYTDEVEELFEGGSADDVINSIDIRIEKNKSYSKNAQKATVRGEINIVPEPKTDEKSSAPADGDDSVAPADSNEEKTKPTAKIDIVESPKQDETAVIDNAVEEVKAVKKAVKKTVKKDEGDSTASNKDSKNDDKE